ncbi:MAG TPA: VWA domain-containing protein [Bryobacteraceae bacterium]|jgi:VWFA-related protein|nr:VWA domain-containing protein [Bryobacteraceae bacterium]
MRLTVAIFGCVQLLSVAWADDNVNIIPRNRGLAAKISENYPHADLRVDVPLVLIPVHVTNPAGVSVPGLKKENFRLFEDDVEQKIVHFSNEDAPLSIGLLFDASGSMENKIKKSWEAAAEFFKTANSDDEFFLVQFSDRPKLLLPFTQDTDEVYQRIARVRPFGRTALLDAIGVGLGEMKKARYYRKAMVIVSDGGDNRSRYTRGEIKNALLESDVQIYAMGIFDFDPSHKQPSEERNGPNLLSELADDSGGRHIAVEKLEDLPAVCARIGKELRDQYILGYYPTNDARDGKHRSVKVSITPPDNMPPLKSYHRRGYQAPIQ